jgi:hypothetical protein
LTDEKKFLYLFQCEEYDIVEVIERGVNEMYNKYPPGNSQYYFRKKNNHSHHHVHIFLNDYISETMTSLHYALCDGIKIYFSCIVVRALKY